MQFLRSYNNFDDFFLRFGRRKLLLLMLPMSTTALATCAVIAGLNAGTYKHNW